LPPARRARGVRAAARPGRDDEAPAGDVALRGARGRGARRRHRRSVPRRPRVKHVNGHRSITEVGTGMQSYYGRPVVKEPVWKPEIPFYFFTGGLGGAAAVLSLAASVAGNPELARAARYWGAVGDDVSPL